ncbi:MAG: LysE family transporter [bacterium]
MIQVFGFKSESWVLTRSMFMDCSFFTVFAVGALAVMSPGPDFIIVTRMSLLHSKRVGIATALGIATGNLWWVASSILGISYVISKTVLLFAILKWIGALYLIYLGIGVLRAKKKSAEASGDVASKVERVSGMSAWKAFRIGLLTNILNPKCALFFISLFSVFITPSTPALYRYAYGLEIVAIAIIWFSLLATVLTFGKVKSAFEHFAVSIDRVTGALLIALGLKIALSKT